MMRLDSPHGAVVRLLVVTCRRLDGDAFAALFRAQADFRVLSTATNINAASIVCQHRCPDAVLLDAGLIDGIGDSLAKLSDYFGNAPILFLDDDVNNGRLAEILALPAVGYFTRNAAFNEIADGIRRLVRGERAFGTAAKERLEITSRGWRLRLGENGSHLAILTPREIEVLKLVALGHSVKTCAELLDLAPSTIDNHKARLMKKLGIHKALDLARFAIREGLITV